MYTPSDDTFIRIGGGGQYMKSWSCVLAYVHVHVCKPLIKVVLFGSAMICVFALVI